MRRITPLLRRISHVASWTTAGAETRRVFRARGVGGEACNAPLYCLILRPNRTRRVDAGYCYKRHSFRGSCRRAQRRAVPKRMNRSRCRSAADSCWSNFQGTTDVVHIYGTWRIRLNDPCTVAMRFSCQITLVTCLNSNPKS